MTTNTTTQLTPTQRIEQARDTIARMQAECKRQMRAAPWVFDTENHMLIDHAGALGTIESKRTGKYIAAIANERAGWLLHLSDTLDAIERDVLSDDTRATYTKRIGRGGTSCQIKAIALSDAALATLTRIEATLAGMEGK